MSIKSKIINNTHTNNENKKIKIRIIVYVLIYFLIIVFLYSNNLMSVDNFKSKSFLGFNFNKFYTSKLIQETGSLEVHFCQEKDCAYFLNYFLNMSKENYDSKKINCAFYDLNEPTIINNIIKNNISVKLFSDNYEKYALKGWLNESMNKELFNLSTNIISVKSKGLMHDKFCMDEKYVLTGSWNPTIRGTEKNDNYILFLNSKSLAENYYLAYSSLSKTQKAKPLRINLSGILIENYFCPEHHCEEEIIKEISLAKKEIKILAFSFTSKPIAEKLVEKQKENISIKVIFEKTRIAKYSQYDYLKNNSITVFKDINKYTMHEKMFLIDNNTVIVGSYNPTNAANTINDENILIIHDKEIANKFNDEFEKLKPIT